MIIYNHAPTEIPDPPLCCDICGYELRPEVPTSLRKFAADSDDIVRCQKCEAQKNGGQAVWCGKWDGWVTK